MSAHSRRLKQSQLTSCYQNQNNIHNHNDIFVHETQTISTG